MKHRADRIEPICPKICRPFFSSYLEPELQSELNQARVVHSIVDDPKRRRSVNVLLSAAARTSHIELRMVEEVEEFRSELEVHAFPERKREVLDDREVGVHESRSVERSAGSCAEFSRRRLLKRAGIEPVLNRMYCRRSGATRITRNRPSLVRIANLVWTLESISVVREENPGSVSAIHDKQWEAGGGMFNDIQLPVAQDRIRRPGPIAAEVFAFSKGQVIQNAGSKVVVQIQLREAPVELRASGKRIINGSRISTQPIRHTGVEGSRPGIAQQGIKSVTCALSF